MARQADITPTTADDLQYGVDDSGYGFDLRPSDGIGSQEYEVDLWLTLGDEPTTPRERSSEVDDVGVEVGCNGQHHYEHCAGHSNCISLSKVETT